MLINETLINTRIHNMQARLSAVIASNELLTLQAWLSTVIDDPYRSEVDLIIYSGYPCGHYNPAITGKETVMIHVPYGTPGLDKLMNIGYIYGAQNLALKGRITVDDEGFPFFVTESIRLLEDDEKVVDNIRVRHLRMPVAKVKPIGEMVSW